VSLVLDGKVALVTGGSRGIGAETVRLFAAAGARVVFSYRQAKELALALMDECGGPTRCVPIEQDLRSPADGRALVGAAVKAFGRLDALVVNHGVWPAEDAPIELMTEEQWRNTIAINLDSVFGLVQASVTQMCAARGNVEGAAAPPDGDGPPATGEESPHERGPVRGGPGTKGHIVLISSTAGQRGEAMHADYAVTKGALISLTKSLSTELAPRGIMVNCVAPGWVATDMSARTLADPAAGPRIRAGIPVGRVATTREIAGPVLFLCTPLAGFISGEVVNVNGGAVLVG
jgi:3-oxoacyl-[acyl-carrier protein] reductase